MKVDGNAGTPSSGTAAPPSPNEPAVRDRLNRPIEDLRLSVIDRCNLRCRYCMPAEIFGPGYAFLPREERLTFAEMRRLAGAFVRLGVRKLRITGGEPLLVRDLPDLVEQLRGELPSGDIAVTTNSFRLAEMADPLARAGLDRVNVSLDAIDPGISAAMAGKPVNISEVSRGIDAALASGLSVKLNAVIQRGLNASQVLPLARFARERGLVLRFIEYMDVGNSNGWTRDDVFTGADVLAELRREFEFEPDGARTGSDLASRYRYSDGKGGIGLINSVSDPFCRGCSRARLSSDGQLFTCLFASVGTDLRRWLREERLGDREILDRLASIWGERTDRYSELRATREQHEQPRKVEMWSIGG